MGAFASRPPVPSAVTGLVALLLVSVLAFNAPTVFGGGTTYQAEFTEAAGLQEDDLVTVAGVEVGRVDAVELAGDRVLVTFSVDDVWVGDETAASIEIKTLLGAKYLALDPRGQAELDPERPIPLERTASPFDVVEAFNGLSVVDRRARHRPARGEPHDAGRHVPRHPARGQRRVGGAVAAVADDRQPRRGAAPAARRHGEPRRRARRPQRRGRAAARRRQPAARGGAAAPGRDQRRCSTAPGSWPSSCAALSPTTATSCSRRSRPWTRCWACCSATPTSWRTRCGCRRCSSGSSRTRWATGGGSTTTCAALLPPEIGPINQGGC